jgi:hypothetical protein
MSTKSISLDLYAKILFNDIIFMSCILYFIDQNNDQNKWGILDALDLPRHVAGGRQWPSLRICGAHVCLPRSRSSSGKWLEDDSRRGRSSPRDTAPQTGCVRSAGNGKTATTYSSRATLWDSCGRGWGSSCTAIGILREQVPSLLPPKGWRADCVD